MNSVYQQVRRCDQLPGNGRDSSREVSNLVGSSKVQEKEDCKSFWTKVSKSHLLCVPYQMDSLEAESSRECHFFNKNQHQHICPALSELVGPLRMCAGFTAGHHCNSLCAYSLMICFLIVVFIIYLAFLLI